jgi:hypothetical protein
MASEGWMEKDAGGTRKPNNRAPPWDCPLQRQSVEKTILNFE